MLKKFTQLHRLLIVSHFCVGSYSDDMVSEEFQIQEISEAEFRNRKTHFMTKMGPSMGQELSGSCPAAFASKKVGGASKNTSSDDLCISYTPEDSETDLDPPVDKSSPLVKEGNKFGFFFSCWLPFESYTSFFCIFVVTVC